MHTPDQAKVLWCPMVRIARHEVINTETARAGDLVAVKEQHYIVGGNNRDALGTIERVDKIPLASCRCIANSCAMWRWADGADGLGYCGMAPVQKDTTRDDFAIRAFQTRLAKYNDWTLDKLTDQAYRDADAMLAGRNKSA